MKRFYNLGVKPEWWKLAPMQAEGWAALHELVNERDPHWTESARNLIRGIILYLLDRDGRATLRSLRAVLSATKSELEELFHDVELPTY